MPSFWEVRKAAALRVSPWSRRARLDPHAWPSRYPHRKRHRVRGEANSPAWGGMAGGGGGVGWGGGGGERLSQLKLN